VFNDTFNNIFSYIGQFYWYPLPTSKNHRHVANDCQTLSNNFISSTPRHEHDSNSQL
jgi:hypothetical protein